MTAAAPPGNAAPAPERSTLTPGSSRRRFLPNRGRPQFGLWLLLVPVALVVIAQLALLIYTGFLSTQDWTLTQSQVSKGWIGDQNFSEVLDDPVFWRSLTNSALITGISVPIQLLLGILIAYATFELVAGRWVRTALLAPMIVAPVAVGIVWRLMLNVQAGPINSFVLAPLGIDGPVWLGEPGMALVSVIAVEVWEWTPFVLLLVAAGLTAIREDLREAARTDGASTWQRIRFIELPVLKPVILIVVLFRTLESLMSLDVIISLTQGGPGFSTFTLPYYIYTLGLRSFDIGRASAASLMFMVVAVLLSAAIVRAQLRTDTT